MVNTNTMEVDAPVSSGSSRAGANKHANFLDPKRDFADLAAPDLTTLTTIVRNLEKEVTGVHVDIEHIEREINTCRTIVFGCHERGKSNNTELGVRLLTFCTFTEQEARQIISTQVKSIKLIPKKNQLLINWISEAGKMQLYAKKKNIARDAQNPFDSKNRRLSIGDSLTKKQLGEQFLNFKVLGIIKKRQEEGNKRATIRKHGYNTLKNEGDKPRHFSDWAKDYNIDLEELLAGKHLTGHHIGVDVPDETPLQQRKRHAQSNSSTSSFGTPTGFTPPPTNKPRV